MEKETRCTGKGFFGSCERLRKRLYRNWWRLGLSDEEYAGIRADYVAPNAKTLRTMSLGTGLVLLIFTVLALADPVWAPSLWGYAVSSAVCFAVFIGLQLASRAGEPSVGTVNALIAVYSVALYWMAIYTGTVAGGDELAVTFMVVIIVLPMLFNGVPAVQLGGMLLATAVFVACAVKFDGPVACPIDVADAIAFSFLSLLVNRNGGHNKALHCLAIARERENAASLSERMQIIRTMGEIYTSIYDVELPSGNYSELTASGDVKAHINAGGDARGSMRYFCHNLMRSDYTEELLRFTDVDTLQERMADKKIITKQYVSTLDVSPYCGMEHWAECAFIVRDRDADGKPAHVLFTTRDIHEAKMRELEAQRKLTEAQAETVRVQAELEERERALAAVREMEAVRVLTQAARWTASFGEDGALRNVHYSQELRAVLGYTDEEDFPNGVKTWISRVEPADAERFRENFAAALADPTGNTPFDVTCRIRRKDDTVLWIRSAARIFRDETGRAVSCAGIFTDVTDAVMRREAERQLVSVNETQKRQLESIRRMHTELEDSFRIFRSFGEVYSAIYYFELETNRFRKIGVGEELRRYIPDFKNAEEGLAFFTEHMVLPEDAEEMRAFTDLSTLRERMADKKLITAEFRSKVFTPKDPDHPAEWRLVTFIDAGRDAEGRLSHAIFATRSIHDSKLKELAVQDDLRSALVRAESADKAKTNFLFNMSHDIRTPMNAILGFRDLLEKHQDEPEKRGDYLEKIRVSGEVLLSIINNVLEMTRIEQASIELDEVPGSAVQFADSIISMFTTMMQQKNIDFTTDIKVEHPYMYVDIAKVREIFINLLSNAYKYTNPGGKVHVAIEELPCAEAGYAVYRTTVTDTGIGMSEEFLPHLFDEFAREQNTTDAKIEGTGLGMPIVKRLVDFLGGTIEVRSEKGVGTEIAVTMKHRIASEADCVHAHDDEADPTLFAGKRILLAEDNDLNAEIAVEILKEAGFTVDRAEDGKVCVEMMENAPAGTYDAVLMDIQMPRMNGYEAAVAIRKLNDPEKADIPVIAMTANAFEEDKREAFRCGMNGHIAKPVNVKEIMAQLARCIGKNNR
ncbi:MAG: response regulator [Clostridia bacterium]|nr:response regulator [Clostridia bacterium]